MPYAKLERAKKHITDFDTEWMSFVNRGGYLILPKDDAQKGQRSYYLSAEEIPPVLSLIAGDAIQNLRSSLDHLAHHLVVLGKGRPGSFRHAYFPISESAAKYEAESPRKIAGMRQGAIDAINAIEPYQGGAGYTLWQLHELNNIDKHRLILTVYGELTGHSILPSQREQITKNYRGSHPGGTAPDLSRMSMAPSRGRVFLKDGDILLTVPISELEKYMNFVLGLSFGEPKIVYGDPVIHTLNRMAQFVETILRQFEILGLLA
jgi:hypothetical protein